MLCVFVSSLAGTTPAIPNAINSALPGRLWSLVTTWTACCLVLGCWCSPRGRAVHHAWKRGLPRGSQTFLVWLLWELEEAVSLACGRKPSSLLGATLVDSEVLLDPGVPQDEQAAPWPQTVCFHVPSSALPFETTPRRWLVGLAVTRRTSSAAPVAHPRPDPEGWLLWCRWAGSQTPQKTVLSSVCEFYYLKHAEKWKTSNRYRIWVTSIMNNQLLLPISSDVVNDIPPRPSWSGLSEPWPRHIISSLDVLCVSKKSRVF